MLVGVAARVRVLAAVLAVVLVAVSFCAGAQTVTISGRVLDENSTPVAGVRVFVRSSAAASPSAEATSGANGEFTIELPAGHWLLSAEREGFFPVRNQSFDAGDSADTVDISIAHVQQNSESLTVESTSSGVDVDDTTSRERLT